MVVVVVVVVPQCIARPGHTHHGSIWGCSNYGLLAADERTDGTAATKRPSRYTYVACRSLSFHVDDDPPAGDVSLQPARPLPRINVRVQGSTEERLLWEPNCPAFVQRRRPPRPPILETAGWMITRVRANAIYLSSCSSWGHCRDGYQDGYQGRGNGGTKCQHK